MKVAGLGSRWIVIALMGLLIAGAGTAWLERGPLLAWYDISRLKRATDAERAACVDRVAGCGEAAVPGLLSCLTENEVQVCTNARAALAKLAQKWGKADPRTATLAQHLAESFERCSPAGQASVLELETAWLTACAGQAAIVTPLPRVLALAAQSDDSTVHQRALSLATSWLAQPKHAEAVAVCGELVRTCLKDGSAATRLEAVRLAVHKDIALGRLVAALLDDPAPEVRRAALAAIGGPDAEEAVATDDLLRSLHDSDADARRLCEAALRSRGLGSNDVALARLITDANPGTRLQVLERLSRAANLEPGVWLRRLSQDTSPAVRAAAVRAATEFEHVDLSDQLERMARQDPSDTVRQLAQHYLAQQNERGSDPKR
jgi:hypothetical protein